MTLMGRTRFTPLVVLMAIVTFLRQTELGAAALPAGFGFAALAASSAIRIAMFYVQFSSMAHHTPTSEIARVLGLGSLGGRIFEIGGVVLVAVAMFQRRTSER